MLACKLGVEDNFLDNIAKNSTTGHFDNIAIAGGKSKHTRAITNCANNIGNALSKHTIKGCYNAMMLQTLHIIRMTFVRHFQY